MTVVDQPIYGNAGTAITMRHMLVVVATLGVMFQIGHFFEHAVQFGVWVFGPRSAPWMSAPAMWLVHQLGAIFYPMPEFCTDVKAFEAKQMLVSMEILHLIGNSIFLVTIGAICFLMRSRLVMWALFVETFHLYEHIMLTATTLFLGKPVGLSTLFGGTAVLFDKEGMVGFRVGWHFAMNFVPSILIMFAIMRQRSLSRHI